MTNEERLEKLHAEYDRLAEVEKELKATITAIGEQIGEIVCPFKVGQVVIKTRRDGVILRGKVEKIRVDRSLGVDHWRAFVRTMRRDELMGKIREIYQFSRWEAEKEEGEE
jgi:hypothetical protein